VGIVVPLCVFWRVYSPAETAGIELSPVNDQPWHVTQYMLCTIDENELCYITWVRVSHLIIPAMTKHNSDSKD
jgi:hypothetical protein